MQSEELKQPLEALESMQDMIQFDPIAHAYFVSGTELRSVTTVNSLLSKPALTWWAAKTQRFADMRAILDVPPLPNENWSDYVFRLQAALGGADAHKQEALKAAGRGTRIHAIAEGWSRERLKEDFVPTIPEDELEREAKKNIYGELAKHEVRPVAAERRILLEDLLVCGTFDLLAFKDGKLSMVDLKTGKAMKNVYAEHRLQQAAYREGLYRLGFPNMESWIMHINRESGAVTWWRLPDDHRADFEAFSHLVEVASWHAQYEKETGR